MSTFELNKLITLLRQADIEFTPTDLADVLWLASFITASPTSTDSTSSFPEIENQKATDSPPPSTDETDNQTSESETTENIHSPEDKLKLYPNSTTGNSGKAGNASAIRVPRKNFLPNRCELMRALRPLQHKVSNPYHLELSIEETVNLSAQLGWIQGVAIPAKMAWLELILIVDESPSMQMWDKTIHEWLSLLQRNRAFENIRIYRMDASQATPTFKPAKPVLSPARQQAIWIVSDCISAAWHSGELFNYLKRWQKLQPLAIVQMLPFNMWKRTALGRGEECRFYPPVRAGLPTAQWRSDAPETVLNLPVFTLDVDSHSVYAQLFVAARDVWSSGFVLTAATKYSVVPPAPNNELSPEEIEKRLTQFRRLASPSAQTLAAYLAAVPLTLPIMRLVQDEMWKKYHDTPPQQSHLAEVLLSGLVKQRELFGVQGYDFLAGLRPKLLDGISVYEEGAAVLRVVSDYVSTHAGSCVDFRALLENPEGVENLNTFELQPDVQHFAEVGAEVLARMGGKYQAVATYLTTNTLTIKTTSDYEGVVDFHEELSTPRTTFPDKYPSTTAREHSTDIYENPLKNIKLFYSYSHRDKELRDRLEVNLAGLKRRGIINEWHDRKIGLGAEWRNVLDENLKAADIILLLISPDFIASDYCYDIEMTYAMQQHEAGKAVVIPIILESCDTQGLPFMKLQCAPRDMIPVTAKSWTNQNEAFIDIANKIRMVAEDIRKRIPKMNSSILKQETEKRSIHIFVSYSAEDRALCELLLCGLRAHLATRKDCEYVLWTDEKIDVGANWQEKIEKALKNSDVTLLLVDASFAVSSFIKEKELPAFFAKNNKEFLIIPILLREYAFSESEFEQISGLQFFQTYCREYGFNKPIERNKLLPFDRLGESRNTTDEQLNRYYKNLADHIHEAIFPRSQTPFGNA